MILIYQKDLNLKSTLRELSFRVSYWLVVVEPDWWANSWHCTLLKFKQIKGLIYCKGSRGAGEKTTFWECRRPDKHTQLRPPQSPSTWQGGTHSTKDNYFIKDALANEIRRHERCACALHGSVTYFHELYSFQLKFLMSENGSNGVVLI